MIKRRYTRKEIAQLIKLSKTHSNPEIARILGRSVFAVQTKLNELKVRRTKSWTPEELARLRSLYDLKTNAELAAIFGVKEYTIDNLAHRLKLKKSGNPSCFSKGHTPWNYGKKIPTVSENARKTQFKKGFTPRNALQDGAIVVRQRIDRATLPQKFIRVGPRKWEQLSRHTWIKHHGPIPPGHCVSFIDGNSLNCDIENLRLITRKENMLRNSGAINLPDRMVAFYLAGKNGNPKAFARTPELIKLKRDQLISNRTIKAKSNAKAKTN